MVGALGLNLKAGLLVVAGVAVVGAFFALRYQQGQLEMLEARNVSLAAAAENNAREVNRMARVVQLNQEAAAESAAAKQQLAEQLTKTTGQLAELEAKHVEVHALRDCGLPGEFVDWLQPNSPTGGNGGDRAAEVPTERDAATNARPGG